MRYDFPKVLVGHHHMAHPESEFVADLDGFANGYRLIADLKVQHFIARFIEFNNRARGKFDDVFQAFFLRG